MNPQLTRSKMEQHTMNSWSHAEGLSGVGSGRRHTPLEIRLSLLHKISHWRAQFPLQRLVILRWQLEETVCKEKHNSEFRKSRRSTFGLISRRTTLRETISTTSRPRTDYQQEGNFRRLQQPGETLCKAVRTVVSLRSKKPIKLRSSNSQIQTHS